MQWKKIKADNNGIDEKIEWECTCLAAKQHIWYPHEGREQVPTVLKDFTVTYKCAIHGSTIMIYTAVLQHHISAKILVPHFY